MQEKKGLHIAKILKEERITKVTSQEEIDQYCCISKSSVSKWEKGITRPSIYQLPQIADFYNVTIQKLLTGKEKDE